MVVIIAWIACEYSVHPKEDRKNQHQQTSGPLWDHGGPGHIGDAPRDPHASYEWPEEEH
jgi:hypothetical protein